MKPKGNASEIVDIIFEEIIENTFSLSVLSGGNEVPVPDNLLKKYRIAIALLAIIAEVQKRSSFIMVQEEFERRILDPKPTPDAMFYFTEIKKCMLDLSELLAMNDTTIHFDHIKHFALAAFGITIDNPIELINFEGFFVSMFTSVSESLQAIRV